MAAEVLREKKFTKAADIFSLGATILELVSVVLILVEKLFLEVFIVIIIFYMTNPILEFLLALTGWHG